ncbi:AbiU2 domain-containing protein [Azotobacter armeniacus]
MTAAHEVTVDEFWSLIKKEITGIQLVWEVANSLYFQPRSEGWSRLGQDAPLLFGLTQTVYVESLLIRVARLMDPASSGKGGHQQNLSLLRLSTLKPSLGADEAVVRGIWDGSGLKRVRDKYLSHNDLERQLAVEHSVNIPLTAEDIRGLRQLVDGLLEFQQAVNLKLRGASLLHEGLCVRVQAEVNVLSNTLLGGEQFFELLPEHECLQQAWGKVKHG